MEEEIKQKIKIKRDKFFRKRGSYARIIQVKCAKCGKLLFLYQKDGPGWLKRCYFNRIISPNNYSNTKKLECCQVIGTLMIHKDGRPAFNLIRGRFKRSYSPKAK